MTKSNINNVDVTERVITFIKGGENIPLYKVGEVLGYSRQSTNDKIKRGSLRFSEIIAVLKHFGYTIEISKDGMTLKL